MSQEDEDFFIALHQQQEIEQAVAAIERGVSLSMVFAILGRRIAIKEANRWNQFLQTDQAQFIFQQSGLGVKDKGVMKQLSVAYALLSEDEKAALSNQLSPADPTSENAADDDNDKDNILVQAPSVNTNMVRGTVSAKVRHKKAKKVMDAWLDEAVNVTKTCSCKFVIFAVTNHLGPHSFQFTRCTPGATISNQAIAELDGDNCYPACLQALISGAQIGQVAAAKKMGKTLNFLKPLISQLTHAMTTFVNTDHNLWVVGYRLKLSTSPAFCVEWLKTPTRDRKIVEVCLLFCELRQDKICLIERGIDEVEPIWDPIDVNICLTCRQPKPPKKAVDGGNWVDDNDLPNNADHPNDNNPFH
ncbi:hypothetical protein PCANC_02294 [Puccinia coronata f. sp. avenae]|uniref:Uncharacterized protein n=1 Tax=Puccinia coronata f. sp. avenae TaxID=200324 RepID=A0A2N5VZH8_9BASI|nr:hypothetical protein PCANC_02294 [Puccinia coronata f. sp. avenae]